MKHCFFVTVLVLLFSISSIAQWTQQLSPVKNDLADVAFFSPNLGYAVGTQGTVLRTLNGGRSWQQVTSPDSSDILSVAIPDSLGVMVTTAATFGTGAVFESKDRGLTWVKTLFDTRSFYATAINQKKLYSASSAIYTSGNAGLSWQRQKALNGTSVYTNVSFTDERNGIVAGNISGILTYSADILKTPDGNKWYKLDVFSYPNANAYLALTALDWDKIVLITNFYNRFSTGDSSQIVLLSDLRLARDVFGDTIWKFKYNIVNPSFFDNVSDCKFFSNGKGFITSKTGVIYTTANLGKKLTTEYKSKAVLNALFMVNENTGYAVGEDGLILKREVKSVAEPASVTYVKLYPNPARNSTTISFKLTEQKLVTVQVTSQQGNIVWLQKEKLYNSGNQQLQIPVNNLQPGLYQVNLLSKGITIGSSQLIIAR